MNKTSFHILRVGLAITFLWIGILILKEPGAWSSYINPWVTELLNTPAEDMMIGTAIFDMIVGAMLLFDVWIWLAALLAAAHMVMVLIVSGINEATVRDIAILAGSIALFFDSVPTSVSTSIRDSLPARKPKIFQ